jgi:hypothetical protein
LSCPGISEHGYLFSDLILSKKILIIPKFMMINYIKEEIFCKEI